MGGSVDVRRVRDGIDIAAEKEKREDQKAGKRQEKRGKGGNRMGKKNDVQRLPAEALFQKEIDALIQAEQDPVPTGWNMSPRSVLTYICGGKAGDMDISPKYIGN